MLQHVVKEVMPIVPKLNLGNRPIVDGYKSRTSHLANVAKKVGVKLSKYWRLLVDIRAYVQYVEASLVSKFLESIREWVSGIMVHSTPNVSCTMDEELVLANYGKRVRHILGILPGLEKENAHVLSIKE